MINVIINCGILTEGVDIPRIDSILLARPTKSTILLQQILGRGMRLYEGKDHCLVVDFTDKVDSKNSLATVEELIGIDGNSMNFRGADALTIEDEITSPVTNDIEDTSNSLDSLFDGTINTTVTDHGFLKLSDKNGIKLKEVTPYHWIRTNPGEFSMYLEKNRFLIIRKNNGRRYLHSSFNFHRFQMNSNFIFNTVYALDNPFSKNLRS